MIQAKGSRILVFLVALTVLSSIGHYVHNVIHFEHYPEPEWLNPQLVDAFWFIMTPFAIIGLFLDKVQMRKYAFISLTAYCLMNMLTLLHYACEVRVPISLSIHFLIWFEVVCAGILLFYVIWKYWPHFFCDRSAFHVANE